MFSLKEVNSPLTDPAPSAHYIITSTKESSSSIYTQDDFKNIKLLKEGTDYIN